MVHHAGAGCAGSPWSAAVPPRTAAQSPRRCRRTALPERWGRLESVPRDRAVTFVTRRVQLLHQPRVGTTLVHLFERLGLVNLQDSHDVQGGGCLARSAISFGRVSGCPLTGLGREMRTVPPSGGVSWAQVPRDRSLHLGNARVPPGHSAVEGSEDGGGGRAASGRERAIHDFISSSCTSGKKGTGAGRGCEPRPAPRNQSSRREGLGLGGLVDLQPDAHGCPGKHGHQLWVRCGGGDNTRGGQPHRTFILRGCEPIPRSCDLQTVHRMKCLLC